MSGKGGGGGGGSIGVRKGSNGISDIPAVSRKMVLSLKEIVNSPEAEIYATLKECNMDPNEAVNRLLSQDPFHEVKRKREKKKESRDTTDSKSHGANNMYSRGNRGGSDRYAGRSVAAHFSSGESGHFQGKSMNKRENGIQGYAGSASSVSGIAGRYQPSYSDSVDMENPMLSVGLGDGISSSLSGSGHQSAWFGAASQMSMADIVKMGRPQFKTANPHQNLNMHYGNANVHEADANQHVPFKDEWPSIEKPVAASISSIFKAPTESELCTYPSNFESIRANQHPKTQSKEIHVAENGPTGPLGVDHVQPDSVSGTNIQENDAGVSSGFDNSMYNRLDSYQHQNQPVKCNKEEDDTSSVVSNLQQLSIENHDHEALHEEDRPGVIIPNHLLVHNPECSQLSFGSFGGFGSRPLSNNLEEASDVAPSMEHSDARNEFYGDEHLGSTSNVNMVHAANTSAGNYSSLDSQREVLKQENCEVARENQYAFAQSEPGYTFDDAKRQLHAAFDASQTSTQMQNLGPFSNVTQGYTNSIPNTLLAQSVQSVREPDLQYSPFPAAQSILLRNSNTAPLSGQSISMPEALRGSDFPLTQSMQQTLPGANVATGPALPQHLAVHPYSQPSLPLTHFANMISYPLLPQSYPYLPSAFQQTIAGNNSYHQSLAALLPHYKNSIAATNLPLSATAAASTYSFGNSTNAGAGNFSLNPPAAPSATTLGYGDVLSSQFKDSNHLLSLQQNENSAMLLQGPGSRTMSALPTNTFYNLQGQQNQQTPAAIRQPQQLPSQLYGSLGYPNFYQSQTAISLEQQQHMPREVGGSQGQPSKQTQQIWQNSY